MLAQLPIPRTIQAVIEQRLERLSVQAREMVTAAAVLGQAAEFDLLAALAGGTADEALLALESALNAGIMVQMDRPSAANGYRAETYGLSHDLIHRVVLAGLSGPRKRTLQQRAYALVLEQSRAHLPRTPSLVP